MFFCTITTTNDSNIPFKVCIYTHKCIIMLMVGAATTALQLKLLLLLTAHHHFAGGGSFDNSVVTLAQCCWSFFPLALPQLRGKG